MNPSGSLFWDVNYDTIEWEKNSQFLISRELMRGTLEDCDELKKYYGLEKIKDVAIKLRYLDKKTLNFCSSYFVIPKEQFRCWNTFLSIQKLWNY